MKLWYTSPAQQWVEAMPLGNGRLGAMVFGGPQHERLQLNEETLFAGGPYDPTNPDALQAWPEVKRRLFAGDHAAAQALADRDMMARPLKQMPYQALGDLLLDFDDAGEAADYRRELDIDAAVATVTFTRNGVKHTRTFFISPVDQVLVVRLSADAPGAISVKASLHTPLPQPMASTPDDRTLSLVGRNGDAMGISGQLTWQAMLQVEASGGAVSADGETLHISNANDVVFRLAMATSFKRFDEVGGDPLSANAQTLHGAARRSFDAMLADHMAAHRSMFRRVSLDLGETPAAHLPTDQRIHQSMESDDPALVTLYFQFARYLMICCSRPGTQPATLQGLWNDSIDPPWGSRYTININTQMNYWPAEPTHLGECVLPLVEMVEELAVTGAQTARVHYGAGGWVCHHNTDLWRATAPIDAAFYGLWPTGGAWLCKHLFDHYDYGRDATYLARIYPTLKGAAQFFMETLSEEPVHGWRVTAPSISPENAFMRGGERGVSLCVGPAMDTQILRDLFSNTLTCARTLGVDAAWCDGVQEMLNNLPPHQVGQAGQLQEWLEDWDTTAPEVHHRHVSHLYALYPSDQIDRVATPELARAARRSLEMRGDDATGWGIGWRINLWTALHDGDHAYAVLKKLLGPERTYPNMFDAHPPFQIDGNFGGASGVGMMLLQDRRGELRLLPALPGGWPRGSVRGLRARGGFEVDLAWNDGRLTQATITSNHGERCTLRTAGRISVMRDGQPAELEVHGDGAVSFSTSAGGVYVVVAN